GVNTAILNAVDHEIPTFLQSAISKSARASYEAAITSARSGGVNDPIDVFLVATRYIFGLLAKEYVNRGHGPKGSSV
ncbi:MAG TPA: hypothetical protein VMR25_15550, partial [Planctomycetaceae bacterium]|nr:hypothetical protein [Planctomycetaceae bacterium]